MRSTLISVCAFCPWVVLLYSWGLGFLAIGDLVDVSGNVAQRRLSGFWPKGLDGSAVSNCSVRTRLTAESQETLIGMSCNVEAANTWRTQLRNAFAQKLDELDEDHNGIVEVRTSHTPMHPTLESAASWWHPTGEEFTSYQAMAWYKTLNGPVARSYAFQYDDEHQRLWLSLIVQRDNGLWKRGEGTILSESEFKKAR